MKRLTLVKEGDAWVAADKKIIIGYDGSISIDKPSERPEDATCYDLPEDNGTYFFTGAGNASVVLRLNLPPDFLYVRFTVTEVMSRNYSTHTNSTDPDGSTTVSLSFTGATVDTLTGVSGTTVVGTDLELDLVSDDAIFICKFTEPSSPTSYTITCEVSADSANPVVYGLLSKWKTEISMDGSTWFGAVEHDVSAEDTYDDNASEVIDEFYTSALR